LAISIMNKTILFSGNNLNPFRRTPTPLRPASHAYHPPS
jgi:hypothetical protein